MCMFRCGGVWCGVWYCVNTIDSCECAHSGGGVVYGSNSVCVSVRVYTSRTLTRTRYPQVRSINRIVRKDVIVYGSCMRTKAEECRHCILYEEIASI